MRIQRRGRDVSMAEMEVMFMVARGKTDKQIGRELGKSPNTVRQQVRCVREKLGASTRAQAAVLLLKMK